MKEIKNMTPIRTTVRIPGSKSITHRALITAGLARGDSLITDYLSCEDTLFTANALKQLGVSILELGDRLKVSGPGPACLSSTGRMEIHVGNSGTSFRLLLSVLALGSGEFLLTGSPRMLQRPVGPLVEALNALGVKASFPKEAGFPPVLVKAQGIPGGRVTVQGDLSSQFVSSLLLAGPCARKDVQIDVVGKLVSRPYVDITLDVMSMFGVQVEREGYRHFRIPAGQAYRATTFRVQGDASSASYFWAAAAITGGMLTSENIYPNSTRQGDIRLLDIFERMGCRVNRKTDRVTVHGAPLEGIEADMSAMPDLVPTLAAVALFANGTTVIKNVSHLRHKESDRLASVTREWRRLGARIEEQSDGLVIRGGARLSGVLVDPHDDHRLAMSLAVIGLRVPGIRIKDEDCVNKSFPGFWDLWDHLYV
jgi:3-phosphoshikimate 1-carboxyvinyltransferase